MPYYGNYFGLAAATVDNDAIAAAVWSYSGTRQINSVSGTIGGLSDDAKQDVADALLLAPSGVAAAGSAMDYLADIVEDTGTTLPGTLATLPADIDTELTSSHGAGSWERVTTGGGARTVVITVDDGTDPLQNARIRLTEGVSTYVGQTDVDGEITFNIDDATYTVAITKAGYTYAGTSLVVNGNEAETYSMAAVSFSASEPGQSTGWVYCYDDEGNAEADVSISVQLTATPETDSYAFDTVVRVVTSEVDGLAEFTGLWIGATYRARRYNGPWYSFVVPNAASFALPVLLGR